MTLSQSWVISRKGPGMTKRSYDMEPGTSMVTHVLPVLDCLEDGELIVVEWQPQACNVREGFAPQIFVKPTPGAADTFYVLEEGTPLEIVGIGYLQVAGRTHDIIDMVTVLRNSSSGYFSDVHLPLPYDLKDLE